MLDVVRPCVLSNGGDVMPHLMLPTVCAIQGWRCHVTPDVVRSCVQSNGSDIMRCTTSFDCLCCPKGDNGMPRSTLPFVCAVQQR